MKSLFSILFLATTYQINKVFNEKCKGLNGGICGI